MMTDLSLEMNHRTKSKIISVVVHLLLLLLALWPLFRSVDWTEESPVVIEFTETVVTLSDDISSSAAKKGNEVKESSQNASSSPAPKNNTPRAAAAPSLTQNESDITRPDRSEAETDESATVEKEVQGRNFSNLFGAGGSGTNSTGSPEGDPDINKLRGLSKGVGTVGRGMTGREVVYAPTIEDKSQKTGRVVVEICVDSDGQVMSAKYTQRGSNTTDRYLVGLAEEAAMKWRFSRSEQERQCGVITIDFKVE